MSTNLSTLGAALCALVLVLLFGWRHLERGKLPLPPGPKGYPVIGNLLDLPKENDWLVYSDLQKTYGDIMYISVLGKPFLIISSLKIASDLLEKRSTFYSARMPLIFGGELCNFNRSFALQEGIPHREARKAGHRALNATAMKQWRGLQEAEAHKTLRKLLHSPTEFSKHFDANAASSIMRISYGYELEQEDDPLLRMANRAMESFNAACYPGRWIVDTLPFLKHVPEWVPGAGFQKTARVWRERAEHLFNDPFNLVKDRMRAGIALPSMTAQLLETRKPNTDEEHIKNAVGALYGGGVDTTPSALTSFIMAMTLYPDVQKKAQEELDHVVGKERLPTFADRPNLPYMNAVVKEVLRWAAVVPMCLPHRLIKEDEYNGYRIPKDTIVLTNIWHMNRDISAYGPDVDRFRPERFLGRDPAPRGFSTSSTREFGSPAFGFGRRVCPGVHVADPSLFIVCSNILATMVISPVSGVDGRPLLPEIKYTSGVIVHAKPFQTCITPRSAKAVELINGAH
ncbi:cytochrome P450 [Calocera viscosa TUFC12733]|uniref:Cytochrome P450 n=1 Tax=Calocera viscosa (strain TUFC12733) TaxID=1330018 RepID=A0A167KSZ5_CALVF|nr:cytochrome P450 [Calocera viscosa TUFC12733]